MVVYDYDTPMARPRRTTRRRRPTGARATSRTSWAIRDAADLGVGSELRRPAVPRPQRARVGRVGSEGLHQRAAGPGDHDDERSARDRGRARVGCPDRHTVPVSLRDPYHQPHLQNFFDAVRGKAKLNCPSEVAYETAVAVLKVNEAIEAKSRLPFNAADSKCRRAEWTTKCSPAARSLPSR